MSVAIHTLDLNYLGIPGAIASYLVLGPEGPILIETGPASTLPALEAGLARHGLVLQDVHEVLVTHIHLDHAGAAGHLARNGTRIHVHEFGAKHLIDPSKLIDSARRIYKDQMQRLWGDILPVPASLIVPVHDGDVIDVAGLRITAIETPGHARHHHAFAIQVGLERICLAGDIAGITVPGLPGPPRSSFLAIPTPPPEFDPAAWIASVDRLLEQEFDAMYLTHFGRVDRPQPHLRRVNQLVQEHASFVCAAMDAGHSRDAILQGYVARNRELAAADGLSDADFARYVSFNLLAMNVDGILRYWTKRVTNSK